MNNRNITFIIASNTGSSIKKIVMSRISLFVIGLFFCIGIGITGLIIFDYCRLKFDTIRSDFLAAQIAGQDQEIAGQRKQIQLFAAEINTLKTKLVNLNTFEKKIRIIANIEKTVDQDNVFGVGGSIPDDLDANILLSEKHGSLLREMHEQVEQLSIASENQQEGFESLLQYLDDRKNLLASTPAISPTRGWVTSHFGYRKSPFTGLREFHKGLDISTRIGTPVIATADGLVTFSNKKGLLGNMVVIDHGHGMSTRYAHLSKILKPSGSAVKRGDIIAEVGNTGRSTGPHLHYDVRLNGISVSPEQYILD